MNVLFWKIGAVGDVLMSTPLVRQVRRALPSARLDYLVGTSASAALEGNPQLDRVIRFDEDILHRREWTRLGEIRRALAGYDMLFVLDKHWIFASLARLSRVPCRVGFRRRRRDALGLTATVPYGALRHEIQCYLDLAEAAGLAVDRADTALEFTAASAYPLAPGTTVLVNSGGMNPGEASQVRRMPDPLFSALVSACARQGPVAFLGTAREREAYEPFAGPDRLNLCGRTDLRQAAGVLHGAARVITTDTGLMHLAGALNPQLTAVFGPTHPARKCPPGARWVWTDEDRYEADYETYGRQPRGPFFTRLDVAELLRIAFQPP